MKKIVLCLFFIISVANASSVLSSEELESVTKSICADHPDPNMCIKGFNKIIAYTKANDDYFYFCEKSKGTDLFDKDQCDKSKELRDFIDRSAN